MVGSPLPCGIVLAKKVHVDRIARSIEYVGTLDTTILGSRNAITPLFMWYAFRTVGIEGFRRWIRQCFETADYAVARLNEIGRNAWRHRNSVTVVFDRPSPEMAHRWQLAAEHNIVHLITMPHVTTEQIDRLVDELARRSPVTTTPKAKA
jgi:histidine decarboxylase